MNIFRFVADFLHLASFIILILKIKSSQNCLGISYKTQEMYLVVFVSRYLDLFLYWVSFYNFTMKILFIGCTAFIIYLIRFKKPHCLSYDPIGDDFKREYLYIAAFALAICIHTAFSPFEFTWSFSIWLEALAILPQLDMIRKLKELENITLNFVVVLGCYRFFYIINWIYRFYMESYLCWTSILGGIVQTVLYADFVYYYLISKSSHGKSQLPV